MAVLDGASLGQGEAGVDRPGPGAPERALFWSSLPLPDLGTEQEEEQAGPEGLQEGPDPAGESGEQCAGPLQEGVHR